MDMHEWKYEIIVVDDGSKDSTQSVLKKYNGRLPLRVITHEKNLGYGAALRSGFAAATHDWIFFMDSDRQFHIEEIDKLIPFADDHELVVGYRVNRRDTHIRLLNAWLFHKLIFLLFGLAIRDIDCAFKLIKRDVIERAHLESAGAFINSELLIKAQRMGYRIKEVPVGHYPRIVGTSTGANIRVILRALGEVLKFRLIGRVT